MFIGVLDLLFFFRIKGENALGWEQSTLQLEDGVILECLSLGQRTVGPECFGGTYTIKLLGQGVSW